MFPVKITIAGLIVAAAMAGCVKKKASDDKEFATSTSTTPTPSASQDIFDEFYKADTVEKKMETKSISPEPVVRGPATAGSTEFTPNGRFVVQVSTVRSRTLADKINTKLSSKGYPSYVAEVQNPTPSLYGPYYRIRIGGFKTLTAARSFGENNLKNDGYDYWVDNRSNDNVGLQGNDMGSGDTYYATEPSNPSTPPVTDYQSASSIQATPSPVAPPPAPEPVPATPPPSPSTPENTSKEFEATPSPAPEPAGSENEWGNEGW